MPVRTFGVDWAVYQRTGDADQLRRQGGSFLIAKVSQDHGADAAGDDHIRAAKRAGLVPGAYHFLIEPGAGKGPAKRRGGKVWNGYRGGKGAGSPEEQAANFVARCRAANGGSLDGLICAVDLEALNETSMDGTSRVIRSRPRAYHARAFVEAFHKLAPGHPILVYTTASYLRGADLRKWAARGPVGLWLAYWTASGTNEIGGRHGIPESRWTTRYGGVPPTIVQYQSGGHGGRAGGVWSDLNASDLTRAQLVAELTRPKVGPGPDPDPTPDPDPDPSPIPDTRYCLRLQGLALLDPETGTPQLVAPYGSALLVAAGPIGSDELDGGLRWAPSLLVLGLAAGPSFSHPLMAEAGCPAPLGIESPFPASGPSEPTSTD